jgi:hypothetical protein
VAAHVGRLDRGPQAVWIGTRVFVETAAPSPHRPIPRDTWALLTRRAARLAERFRHLVQHWQAGTLPRLRPGRPARAAPRPAAAALPREHGWINRRLPATAPSAGLLDAMLQAPMLRDFVAEVPRAGRLLRPLVHALGLTPPDWLRLPKRPRSPASASAAAPPAPASANADEPPAPAPTPYRPLQPYLRAAVRALRKKYGA